jgi:large subunit ribosomal protein L25
MDMVPLKAEARTAALKPKALRMAGKVACVVYGAGLKTESIECEKTELTRVYTKAGASTLVELAIGSKKVPVLVHQVDLDPLSGQLSHVDFYAVDMTKEIDAKVPVRFTGEAPAIKEHAAIFVVAHDHVTVKCLPKDLPHELLADISGMKEFHDVVTVAGLQVPAGVKIKEAADMVIAVVQQPREEEVVEVAAPVEGAEGATAAAGTEGATAEGAAAPAAGADAAASKKEEKKK